MKWDRQVRAQAAAHLKGHGLDGCPVCRSETLDVHGKPVLLVLGGAAWPNPPHQGPLDKDTQVDFMVRIECGRCGYNMLFDSARFYGGDIPAFEADCVADEGAGGAIAPGAQRSRSVASAGAVLPATTPL
jgi:hypothetical protein